MKVTNPHARLVNVHVGNGKFVHIGPGETKEVKLSSSDPIFKRKELVKEGPDEDEEVEDETEEDTEEETTDNEPAAKKVTKRKTRR